MWLLKYRYLILYIKLKLFLIPGQGSLQVWVSDSNKAGQGNPPFSGGLQVLDLFCVPSTPHSAEQSSQSPQAAQAKFLVFGPIRQFCGH